MFKILSKIWENKNYIVPKENLLRTPTGANNYCGVEEIDLTKLEIKTDEIIYKNRYHFKVSSSKEINHNFVQLDNSDFKLHILKKYLNLEF